MKSWKCQQCGTVNDFLDDICFNCGVEKVDV
jgi:anaerobic ribonucleoside-triphosphate reductase